MARPATKAKVKALTAASLAPLDRQRFWIAIQGGPRRAIIGLQRGLQIADDGRLGAATLAQLPPADLIDALCDGRLTFLRALSTWPRFGRGWSRRAPSLVLPAAPGRPTTPDPWPLCGKAVAA